MKYQVNDILYTKDGRKIGNCVVIETGIKDVLLSKHRRLKDVSYLVLISDYGNLLTVYPNNFTSNFKKCFYSTPGKATSDHKHYNYKETYPEDFL